MHIIPDVFILAAAHFEEVGVVTCLSEMRGQGVTAVLVAATSGLLNGKRGITLRPDLSLAQLDEFTIKPGQLVVVAGGAESAAAILTDPRAHHLLRQTQAAGGVIAGMRHTGPFIEALGLDDTRFIRHGGGDTAVFVQQLISTLWHK